MEGQKRCAQLVLHLTDWVSDKHITESTQMLGTTVGGATLMTEQNTLNAFIDTGDPTGVDVLDRSDLEKYGECPLQAVLKAKYPPLTSFAAESGQAVHDAYGATVAEFVASHGALSGRGLTDVLMGYLRASRPDVQPDALTGGAVAANSFCYELARIGHFNILCFDGGEGDKCSQLSWEIEGLGLRVTSELDLLVKTAVPTLLEETDYKTGWKHNNATGVKKSLQFQLHAALVFEKYPEAETLAVTVLDTRRNHRTQPAIFERRFLSDYQARIRSAAGEWWRWHDKPIEDVPAWPLQEKCAICDVVRRCTVDNVAAELFNPEDASARVDAMIVAERRKKLMVEYVDHNGPIKSSDGLTEFGRNKPGSGNKKPAALYQPKPET